MDVGGQRIIRSRSRHYLSGYTAFIFVVDSGDRDRVSEVKEELWSLINSEELGQVPVLIFANKQDMPRAIMPAALAEALDLHKLPATRVWHAQPCTAVSGDGLLDGLEWLSRALKASREAAGQITAAVGCPGRGRWAGRPP
jgi:signal recognition particle receptor subunit beta